MVHDAKLNRSFPTFQTEVKVDSLWSDDIAVEKVRCGENIKVKLKGVDESDISPGFMLCDVQNPVKSCRVFDAQVRVTFYLFHGFTFI